MYNNTTEKQINQLIEPQKEINKLNKDELTEKCEGKQLLGSEVSYRTIFDLADDTGKILDVNQRMCGMFGYSLEETHCLSVKDLSVNKELSTEIKALAMVRKTLRGKSQFPEWKFITKDGKLFWGEVRLKYQQLLSIIDVLPDATFVLDREQKVIAWNQAMEEMTGVLKKDVVGKGNYVYAIPFYGKPRPVLIDLVFSEDKEIESKYNYITKKGNTFYFEVFCPSLYDEKGAVIWGKVSPLYNNKGNFVGAVESIRDITEFKLMDNELRQHRHHFEALVRKRTHELKVVNEQLQQEIAKCRKTEETLRESEERYRVLVEVSPDTILVHNKGKVIFINKAGLKLLGAKSFQEITRINLTNLIHPDCWKTVENRWREMEKGNIIPVLELKLIRIDGTPVDVEATITPLTFRGKSVIQAVIRNITERKQAEKALKKSEAKYRELLARLPVLVAKLSPDGTILFLNSSVYTITGYKPEELLNKNYWDIFYPGELRRQINELYLEIASGNVSNIELNLMVKDGSIKTLSWTTSNRYKQDGTIENIFGFGIDITERKKLEKEMARLDQLNLVGEMAAGISHEIRNPLTTVRGFLQLLGGKTECLPYKEDYDLMIRELDRANNIISEFLSLAKNRVVDLKLQNLNLIVKSISALIQADAMVHDKYVHLKLQKIPDLLLDEKEICQLILNLVRNGLDAMSPGGNLTIRTLMDGDDIVLSVQDEGTGIEPEVLERIGTPFFTTKDQGTGLGLAICYSIAARHKATINVETSSTGTTFFVRFKQQASL